MRYSQLQRAAFVLDESAFRQNLALISGVAQQADVEIILALKAFSFWPAFGIAAEYLPGATASSLNEALLVNHHFGVKPHVYCPAYVPREFDQIASLAHHLTFNSLSELERYRATWTEQQLSVGLRVNPMYSPVETDLYNPAAPTGRLGEAIDELPAAPPAGLAGVHVHTLCESSAAATATLIERVEAGLQNWLPKLQWLNLGGGHLMTREDYNRQLLIESLRGLQQRHPHLHVTLEPGSAHAWRTGVLVAHVLDIIENHGVKSALLDVSFTCHMPDTLEMPYKPTVRQAEIVGDDARGAADYVLGGMSCLAGDAIGTYRFEQPLQVGQQVIFEDMLHYTTVKTTMFNGVPHPDLVMARMDGELEVLRTFSYEDYESRLG